MINNNLFNISALFKQLKLGVVIDEPVRITGGLLHLMYKVNTDTGVFAVKLLNPLIMKRETAFDNYVFSEKFARHAHNNGINCVPAISIDNKVVHQYDDQSYLIFPWIEGESGEKKKIEITMCKTIGRLLASIHELNFNEIEDEEVSQDSIEWNQYISMAEKCNAIWFDNFSAKIEFIKDVEEKTNSALKENINNIISHRDLDPKNIMWDKSLNPIVIDWESSGPINSNVELLEVALYWSERGKDKEAFQSVIRSYKDVINVDLRTLINSLYCINDGKLKWLNYNIKRSLGIESSSQEEQLLGTKEVITTLKDIVEYAQDILNIKGYIEELV